MEYSTGMETKFCILGIKDIIITITFTLCIAECVNLMKIKNFNSLNTDIT